MKKKLLPSTATLSFLIAISLTACRQPAIEPAKPENNSRTDELIKVNRYILKRDAAIIKTYGNRRGWNLKETESGLWADVFVPGTGPKITTGNIVSIAYKLELLDGSLCYSSDSLGAKEITIGKLSVEPGLEEGLQMLSNQAEARFVLPPHLAHGIAGDGKCIPRRAIIVYQVKVLSVTKQ